MWSFDPPCLSHSLVFAEFPESEDVVNVRYGISYIGVEQAKRNLYNEINDFNLEKSSKYTE